MLIALHVMDHLINNVYHVLLPTVSLKIMNANYLLIALQEHMLTQLNGNVRNVPLEDVLNVVITHIVKLVLLINIKIYQPLVVKDIVVMMNTVKNVRLMELDA